MLDKQFVLEEGFVGVDDLEVVGETLLILNFCQTQVFSGGGEGFLLDVGLVGSHVQVGQRILDFTVGRQQGRAIIGDEFFVTGLGGDDIGVELALEDGEGKGGGIGPDAAFPVGNMGDFQGFKAEGAGEFERGIVGGLCDADLGVGGDEALLGLVDVGAVAEQFGREADGNERGRGV